jgi:hypothetical protein
LGFFGARKISREERRERQRDDACRAFAAYLAAVYAWVAELREMPPDPRSDVLVRLLDRAQGDAAAWMRQKREQAKLGDGHFQIRASLGIAVARLDVLRLPSEVRSAVDATNDYLVTLAEERNKELKAEWPRYHGLLQQAAALLMGDVSPS